jgi:hypothetical protein
MFIPYLTYLKNNKTYSEFIFEEVQVYCSNVINEFNATQSFVKSLEGVRDSGILEDPILTDVKILIEQSYKNGTIDEAVEEFNRKYPYYMDVPEELTDSDTEEGFIVINVGDIVDHGEFSKQSYGAVRCFLTAYIPQISRGRVNREIYALFENGIENIIEEQSQTSDGQYSIAEDSVLSMDGTDSSTSDNSYFTYVKSFVVTIN